MQSWETPLKPKIIGSGKCPQNSSSGGGGEVGSTEEKRVHWDLINGTKLGK